MANEKNNCRSKHFNCLSRPSFSKEIVENVDYSHEEDRMKSFSSWPIHFPVDPTRLAKSGFYYTGKEDEVVCFSCQGHIKDWNFGDVVQKKHSEFFPSCDFVNNKSKNIPFTQQKKSHVCSNGSVETEIANSNLIPLSEDFDKMKLVQERLKTFGKKWPRSNINVFKMAEAGFFYLGVEDRVQCAFCKGIVSNWEVSDDPLNEHIKHFPWCSYLPHIVKNSNPKLKWFQTNGQDLCGNMEKHTQEELKSKFIEQSQEHVNLIKLGVHLHNGPIHPEQASLDARLRSFITWPYTSPVSKDHLAKAGFFYIGISDHTKCFHCNGGLCNWEHGDDPWFEHARWFQNCDFLRMNKGQAFIESCLREHHLTNIAANSPEQCSSLSEFLMINVDEAMNSPLVACVLESGVFPSYIVRAAILRQLKETGSNFSSVDDLCLAVTYLKEEMEKEPLKMTNLKATDLNICDIDLRKCSIDINKDIGEGTLKCSPSVKQAISGSDVPLPDPKLITEGNLSKDHCLCKICMDKEVGVVFLPCGHLLSCTECSPALKLCPMCRNIIQATVRAYLP